MKMLEDIKKFFGKIFDLEYRNCSHLREYDYLKTKEARIEEHEAILKAISEFWEKHDKYIPKFDSLDGRKLDWKTIAYRKYHYDSMAGVIILDDIYVTVFRNEGTCSYYLQYTYLPNLHGFRVQEFQNSGRW